MSINTIGTAIAHARTAAGLSQRELAHLAGTSQPALARLERGRENPTLATLGRLAAAAGCDVRIALVPRRRVDDAVIAAYKRDVDRTQLRENLKKSPDERLRSLAELQAFGTEIRRAMKRATGPRP